MAEPKKPAPGPGEFEPIEKPSPVVKPSVDKLYSNLLVESIFDVIEGTKKLADAKKELHAFVTALSDSDKDLLLTAIQPTSKRINDIAQSLTAETPSIIVILQTKENV